MDFLFSLWIYGIINFFAKLEAKGRKVAEQQAENDVLNFVIMEDLEYEARMYTHKNKTKGFTNGVHSEEESKIHESF